MWLDAPTVNTHGALPGAVIPPYCVGRRAAAVVPGGGDDDDAGLHGALRGERQRIGVVRLVHAGRDRQIDDADVQGVLFATDVVERGDHVADVAPARAVERLEDDEPRAGRDARARAAGVEAVAAMMPATCVPWP